MSSEVPVSHKLVTDRSRNLFAQKKTAILSDLSIPLSDYKDRSPKGSVDEGIRDLIDEINAIDGLVTTSSCAGRISVYVEGTKSSPDAHSTEAIPSEHDNGGEGREVTGTNGLAATINGGVHDNSPIRSETTTPKTIKQSKSTPGGKGHGGHWLYISHSPPPIPPPDPSNPHYFHNLFSLTPTPTSPTPHPPHPLPKNPRFIRLQFEPLLLHILCSSLPSASPPLSAAISSGFRESGLQSLSCLSHPDTTHPMIGIRSSGMGLQTVIGFVDETTEAHRSLVSEQYLHLIVEEINRRFTENVRRRERFREALKVQVQATAGSGGRERTRKLREGVEWEDADSRARRKREEGLLKKKQQEQQKQQESRGEVDTPSRANLPHLDQSSGPTNGTEKDDEIDLAVLEI